MATRIEFDGWTLLPATGELWRDGSRRRLQTQAVRALLLLLRRPGELVAREELVEDLWPDTVVDYEAGLRGWRATPPPRGPRFGGYLGRSAVGW